MIEKNKIKNAWVYLLLFGILLIIFTVLSTKISFHDAHEYITIAKRLSGINDVRIFSAHSILYPFFIAQFLKIFPYLLTIKLINSMWIFLIGLLFYIFTDDKKALMIWIFSPIAWIISIQTTPALPSVFFLSLAYLSFKKWENKGKSLYFVISGLALGFTFSVYDPGIIFVILFMIAFLYDKITKITILYSLLLLPSLILRMLVDQIVFGFPVYSLIRYVGTNILITLGLNKSIPFLQIKSAFLEPLLFIVIIVPLLFMVYKLDFRIYKKEIFFLIPILVFFFFRGGLGFKYILIFSPIIVFLISKVLTKKQLIVNSILSIMIIIPLTYTYFGETKEIIYEKDLKQIKEDFNFKEIVASKNSAISFSSIYWDKDMQFVWIEDYLLFLNNKNVFNEYKLEILPRINTLKSLEFNVKLNRPKDGYRKDLPLILRSKEEPEQDYGLQDYRKVKCYQILCVYEKI